MVRPIIKHADWAREKPTLVRPGIFIKGCEMRPDALAMRPGCDVLQRSVAGLVLACALAAPAHADADHDRARAAAQAGQIQPLQTVLAAVSKTHPGHILDVELEQENGQWVYEIKLLQADGYLRKLLINARTMEILSEHVGHGRRRPGSPGPPHGGTEGRDHFPATNQRGRRP